MKSNTITLITNGAMLNTNVIASDPIPLDQIWGYAVQAVWTGTPTGTLKLQASCDAPLFTNQTSSGLSAVTNWVDITDSPTSLIGAPGNYMWNTLEASYRFVRLVYTNISGSGVLNAVICVKGM